MAKIPAQYLIRRLLIFFLTIWVAATLIWIIPRLAPGDPISAMIGRMTQSGGYVENADVIVEGLKERFGLNDSLYVQYFRYLRNLATFNFGYSLAYFPTPVNQLINQALPWTLGLLLLAVSITFVVGNLLGALMVWTHTPRALRLLIPVTMIFTSVPSILAALFLLYVFAFLLNWFPMRGSFALGVAPGLNWDFIVSVIRHGTLPALAIILVSFGYWALGMRGMMITVEGEDYMHLAKAKGLRPFYVLYRYMLRNAILPQITAFALALGTLVSGQILVEYIFGYQGMGTLIYDAIVTRDFAVIQGTSFIIIVMTSLAVLVIDLIYPFIDPRISHEGA
jgi:peptide/nickel transport system permease protein